MVKPKFFRDNSINVNIMTIGGHFDHGLVISSDDLFFDLSFGQLKMRLVINYLDCILTNDWPVRF